MIQLVYFEIIVFVFRVEMFIMPWTKQNNFILLINNYSLINT